LQNAEGRHQRFSNGPPTAAIPTPEKLSQEFPSSCKANFRRAKDPLRRKNFQTPSILRIFVSTNENNPNPIRKTNNPNPKNPTGQHPQKNQRIQDYENPKIQSLRRP
jgi:hypothetical protein